MEQTEQRQNALRHQAALISLVVGVGMLGIKMAAYFLTDSAAILSDALESIVHVAATAMAYYSVALSARPADKSHPYGHGKIEFFSAGIEGGLIVLAALAITYEAIRGIVMGRELLRLETGILMTLAAAIINLGLGWFLIRRGRATSSLALVADGKHVLTDSWTSFGVVAGLAVVSVTGIAILDPAIAIAVAINILVSGYRLMRISVGGLMDESDRETLERVAAVINARRAPEWINIHHLRIMRSGRLHNIDFHLIIPFYWNVARAHEFQHAVTSDLVKGLDNNADVLIHLDPCQPRYCAMCGVNPCPERKATFASPPRWTVENLIGAPPRSPK